MKCFFFLDLKEALLRHSAQPKWMIPVRWNWSSMWYWELLKVILALQCFHCRLLLVSLWPLFHSDLKDFDNFRFPSSLVDVWCASNPGRCSFLVKLNSQGAPLCHFCMSISKDFKIKMKRFSLAYVVSSFFCTCWLWLKLINTCAIKGSYNTAYEL